MKKKLSCLLLTFFILTGCGNKKLDLPKNMEIISHASSNIKYETFDNGLITLKIPENFKIDIEDTENKYYTFKITDSVNLNNFVFFNLKSEGFLKDSKTKKDFALLNPDNISSRLPSLDEATTKYYFEHWNEIASINDTGTFKNPKLNNLENIKTLGSTSYGDAIIGKYETSDKKNATSIMLTLLKENNDDKLSTYNSYNTIIISSQSEDFASYIPIYEEIIKSITFTDKFVKGYKDNDGILKKLNEDKSPYINLSSEIRNLYDERDTTGEVNYIKSIEEKEGYIRVYNIKTGQIYRTTNDFFDYYEDTKYIKASNIHYLKKVDGFISVE